MKATTDAKVLKDKLVVNWTGLYKVLALGPCSTADTPDGSPLGENSISIYLPTYPVRMLASVWR